MNEPFKYEFISVSRLSFSKSHDNLRTKPYHWMHNCARNRIRKGLEWSASDVTFLIDLGLTRRDHIIYFRSAATIICVYLSLNVIAWNLVGYNSLRSAKVWSWKCLTLPFLIQGVQNWLRWLGVVRQSVTVKLRTNGRTDGKHTDEHIGP